MKIFIRENISELLKQKGFVLLIAIVIASILLSIGMGIANFTLKELILSSTARNSLYAFYAADTGVECALMWDNVLGTAPRASAFGPEPVVSDPQNPPPMRPGVIKCNGQKADFAAGTSDDGQGHRTERLDDEGITRTTFGFSMGTFGGSDTINDPYVHVSVVKTVSAEGVVSTVIRGDGSNNDNLSSSRRVERALESSY